ncbi:peptide chain release factor N(5)-glutamine methyltransferase [Fulvivirga sp. 29W222]|uniref:peptide chain release factor N(5)-glutamine methyltransferase n=1 Tax=Fulvivirga marina TaxID=2494733 RepID=A0A937KEQ9_9BACT|nr:peptide chain release factor N(5)-glutamine methyltransferase [Fulvivirga marina]MBL6449839.1 peptide chain release factor N(5)-glutamine methyltransferase [Fulvivirga marina]
MSSNIPDSPKKLFKYIIDGIHLEESVEEIQSIAYLVMEHVFGMDRAEIILDRSINVSNSKEKELKEFIKRINTHEPIQYIIGKTEFYGREFKVDRGVLIPRGETEELVQLIIKENHGKKIKFLDIGTGTGCIPITLLKELKGSRAFAIDYDPRAIKVSRKNAQLHSIQVEFMLIDILNEPIPVQTLDVIVSNPPYVTENDRLQMKPNVLKYEPAMALFVEDSDPLLYYRRIAELAKSTLKEHGVLYFEINERFGKEVQALLEVMDYSNVQIVKDLHGKDRIVRASNSVNVLS